MRRVRYGAEQHVQIAWPLPCRDCAALDGELHTWPCCLEECARCGGQYLGDDCLPFPRPAWWAIRWVLEHRRYTRVCAP